METEVWRIVVFFVGAAVIVGGCGFMIWKWTRDTWSNDVDRITAEICGEVDSLFPGQRTVSQKELSAEVKKNLGL